LTGFFSSFDQNTLPINKNGAQLFGSGSLFRRSRVAR
jgi:hypothetical protein